jgi:hypothetical protein
MRAQLIARSMIERPHKGAQAVAEGPIGQSTFKKPHAPSPDHGCRLLKVSYEFFQQARLADPGFPTDDHGHRFSRRGARKRIAQPGQLVLTTHKFGARRPA